MNIPGKNNRISIFWKTVAAFIAFIMILYSLNVLTNIQRQNEVRKEIAESTKLKMEFYIASLQKDVSNIIHMQTSFLADEDLKNIRYLKNTDDKVTEYRSFNTLRNKLKNLVSMNSYLEDASIYLTDLKKKISDTSIKDYNVGEEEIIKAISQNHTLPFTTVNGEIYIIITPNEFGFFENDFIPPDFIICTKISKQKIGSFLEKLSEGSSSKAVMLGDDRGLSLLGSCDPQIEEGLRSYLKNLQDDPYDNIESEMIFLGEQPEKYFISCTYSSSLHSTLLVYTPESKFSEPLSRYTTWTWIFTALTICMILLFSLSMKRMLFKPLNKLINTFEKVEKGDLDISVSYSSHDEFGYLYDKFNSMLNNLKSLIKEVYEQRILVQKAELKQLQYQINPHFLYNSLLILYNLIRMSDSECAMIMAKHLGSYYQYITRSGAEEVPLVKELGHAKDYIAIQSIRFSNRITVMFGEINEKLNDFMVPRLIIQPIIENAFNHGLKDKLKNGIVEISAFEEKKQIILSIEDNGESLDDDKLRKLQAELDSSGSITETTGLVNVHRRLQIKFGKESGLYVSRGGMGGLRVDIRIKAAEDDNDVKTIDS